MPQAHPMTLLFTIATFFHRDITASSIPVTREPDSTQLGSPKLRYFERSRTRDDLNIDLRVARIEFLEKSLARLESGSPYIKSSDLPNAKKILEAAVSSVSISPVNPIASTEQKKTYKNMLSTMISNYERMSEQSCNLVRRILLKSGMAFDAIGNDLLKGFIEASIQSHLLKYPDTYSKVVNKVSRGVIRFLDHLPVMKDDPTNLSNSQKRTLLRIAKMPHSGQALDNPNFSNRHEFGSLDTYAMHDGTVINLAKLNLNHTSVAKTRKFIRQFLRNTDPKYLNPQLMVHMMLMQELEDKKDPNLVGQHRPPGAIDKYYPGKTDRDRGRLKITTLPSLKSHTGAMALPDFMYMLLPQLSEYISAQKRPEISDGHFQGDPNSRKNKLRQLNGTVTLAGDSGTTVNFIGLITDNDSHFSHLSNSDIATYELAVLSRMLSFHSLNEIVTIMQRMGPTQAICEVMQSLKDINISVFGESSTLVNDIKGGYLDDLVDCSSTKRADKPVRDNAQDAAHGRSVSYT